MMSAVCLLSADCLLFPKICRYSLTDTIQSYWDWKMIWVKVLRENCNKNWRAQMPQATESISPLVVTTAAALAASPRGLEIVTSGLSVSETSSTRVKAQVEFQQNRKWGSPNFEVNSWCLLSSMKLLSLKYLHTRYSQAGQRMEKKWAEKNLAKTFEVSELRHFVLFIWSRRQQAQWADPGKQSEECTGPEKWFAKCDKHYPSRFRQTSLATAIANFTKPRTSHFFGLCTW